MGIKPITRLNWFIGQKKQLFWAVRSIPLRLKDKYVNEWVSMSFRVLGADIECTWRDPATQIVLFPRATFFSLPQNHYDVSDMQDKVWCNNVHARFHSHLSKSRLKQDLGPERTVDLEPDHEFRFEVDIGKKVQIKVCQFHSHIPNRSTVKARQRKERRKET